MVLWAGSIQSLEFLKKSWNLPRNFQTWKNFLRFFNVCIDHLFGNLESRERNHCYGKKCEKSLEFWIQKSLRTPCELNPSPHSVIYPICNAPLLKSRQNHRSYVWTELLYGMVFVPAQSYPVYYEHLSDMWLFTLEISAAQLRSVTEIAPKSPFLRVNRSPIRYGFCASAKAIQYSVNTTWNSLNR